MAKSKTARRRKAIRREKHKAEREQFENTKKTRISLVEQTAELEANPPEDGHQTYSPWCSDDQWEEAAKKRETLQGFAIR